MNPFSLPLLPIDDQDCLEPISLTLFADLNPVRLDRKNDDELTSLNWLQKPGVLSSMCNALTGSPHRLSAMGCRSSRRPKTYSKVGKEGELVTRKGSSSSAEKMLNVVLSVRNKRYNGEDSHKPPLSFACMIFMSLESSPTKTLPVKQIYEWIQWKFSYYRTATPGWKNSIRHNLSLNKCFKKVEKFSRKVCIMNPCNLIACLAFPCGSSCVQDVYIQSMFIICGCLKNNEYYNMNIILFICNKYGTQSSMLVYFKLDSSQSNFESTHVANLL